MGHQILFGEALGGYGIQAREKAQIAGMLAVDAREGIIIEAVVVAIVSVGRRPLGMGLEVGLVTLLEECILRGDAGFDGDRMGLDGGAEGGRAAAHREQKGECSFAHARKLSQPARGLCRSHTGGRRC